MKNLKKCFVMLVLSFVLAMIGRSTRADFADGDADVDTTMGTVGIGTATAGQKLTVTGGNIHVTDANGALLLGQYGMSAITTFEGDVSYKTGLRFFTAPGDWNSYERMTITPGGIVNIGDVRSPALIRRVNTIAQLRLLNGDDNLQAAQVLGYYAEGDGGGGPVRIWVSGVAPGTYVDDGGSVIVPTGGNGSAAWVWEVNGTVNVMWFGAKGDGTTDDLTPINNAIAYTSTFIQRGTGTGSFNRTIGTLEFPSRQFVYSGTMHFGIYSYCHLKGLGRAAIIHTGSGACIDIGDGVNVDVMQMEIDGLSLIRTSRDTGTIGIRHRGGHLNKFGRNYIYGFETGIRHEGSEEVTYDFGYTAIANAKWGLTIESLTTPSGVVWKPNNVSIRNLWAGVGCEVGIYVKQAAAASGPGSGGVISIDHVLFQGVSDEAVIVENAGEVSGMGYVDLNHCWFEGSGSTLVDISNSNVNLRNSFICGQGTPWKAVVLRDKTSKINIENIESVFTDSTSPTNRALIQRFDGTTDGLYQQINARGVGIKMETGSTQVVRLTNVVAPIASTNQAVIVPQQVILNSSYPVGNNNYSAGLNLNLTNLVAEAIGSFAGTGYVDIVMCGNDGGAIVGKGWFRGYFKSGNIAWTAFDTSAGTNYALTPSGNGTSYVVAFPTDVRPAWYYTTVSITIVNN